MYKKLKLTASQRRRIAPHLKSAKEHGANAERIAKASEDRLLKILAR